MKTNEERGRGGGKRGGGQKIKERREREGLPNNIQIFKNKWEFN